MEGLSGKTVIVTGAARGIGRATALRFAREHSRIVVADVSDGEQVADEIRAGGGDAFFARTDVCDLEGAKELARCVSERFGTIDVLINNAGILRDAMMKKMGREAWDAVISVNLTGVWNCTSAVLPRMLEQRSGVVLTTSSIVGLCGNIGQSNYAASKWGVIGMTKCWAKEMGKDGLRFNCVAPGIISTEMVKQIPEQILREKLLPRIPMGRLGEPDEVAAAFAFLASDDARYINGAVLSVDGACTL